MGVTIVPMTKREVEWFRLLIALTVRQRARLYEVELELHDLYVKDEVTSADVLAVVEGTMYVWQGEVLAKEAS